MCHIVINVYLGGGRHRNWCHDAGFNLDFSGVSLNIDTLLGLRHLRAFLSLSEWYGESLV